MGRGEYRQPSRRHAISPPRVIGCILHFLTRHADESYESSITSASYDHSGKIELCKTSALNTNAVLPGGVPDRPELVKLCCRKIVIRGADSQSAAPRLISALPDAAREEGRDESLDS